MPTNSLAKRGYLQNKPVIEVYFLFSHNKLTYLNTTK